MTDAIFITGYRKPFHSQAVPARPFDKRSLEVRKNFCKERRCSDGKFTVLRMQQRKVFEPLPLVTGVNIRGECALNNERFG